MLPAFLRPAFVCESDYGPRYVVHDTVFDAHVLINDDTMHGWQFRAPERLDEPTSYYSRASPVAELFAALPRGARVEVAGLGVGTMAALAPEGCRLRFHEIDPAVIAIATEPTLFTFLTRSRARWSVVHGDARAGVASSQPGTRALVVVDAFFGDAVPHEFLVRDVVQSFARTLKRSGLLAFHITSTHRQDDHRPALAAAAEGLACAWKETASPQLEHDPTLEIDPAYDLAAPVVSRWAVLSPDARRVDAMVVRDGWHRFG